MHTVLILGAGKIGSLISGLLAEAGDYAVQVADVSDDVAHSVVDAHGLPNMQAFSRNIEASTTSTRAKGIVAFIVLSATPRGH